MNSRFAVPVAALAGTALVLGMWRPLAARTGKDPSPAGAEEIAAKDPAPKAAEQKARATATPDDKALAAEYWNLPQTVANPGALEAFNWRGQRLLNALKRLTGELKAEEEALARDRQTVRGRIDAIKKLKDFPKPKSFVMHRANGRIQVDGKLDDPAWENARPITEFYVLNAGTPQKQSRTELRMLWDADNLYFSFRCEDDSIEAPKIERDGPVYDHDCVELFLMPSPRWGMYWELNLSPSGSVLDALACKYRREWGSYHRREETVKGLQFKTTKTGPTDKPTGYTIEVAFPIDQLPAWTPTAAAGNVIYLLATRVNRHRGKNTFTAFTPISAWFHNIWCYAPVRLAE